MGQDALIIIANRAVKYYNDVFILFSSYEASKVYPEVRLSVYC